MTMLQIYSENIQIIIRAIFKEINFIEYIDIPDICNQCDNSKI